MRKFLFGFISGFATRHLLFPNATSNEVTEALTDAVKSLQERLDAKENDPTVKPPIVNDATPEAPPEETP